MENNIPTNEEIEARIENLREKYAFLSPEKKRKFLILLELTIEKLDQLLQEQTEEGSKNA